MLTGMTTEDAAAGGHRRNNLGRTLKVIATLHAAMLLIQAISAGYFMAGDPSALRIHQVIGTSVLYPVAIGQAILGGVLWRRKELTLAYPLLCVGVVLAEGAQLGLGFTDQVTIHVPLGVALFGAAVALLFMGHRPAPPEPRDASEAPPDSSTEP